MRWCTWTSSIPRFTVFLNDKYQLQIGHRVTVTEVFRRVSMEEPTGQVIRKTSIFGSLLLPVFPAREASTHFPSLLPIKGNVYRLQTRTRMETPWTFIPCPLSHLFLADGEQELAHWRSIPLIWLGLATRFTLKGRRCYTEAFPSSEASWARWRSIDKKDLWDFLQASSQR